MCVTRRFISPLNVYLVLQRSSLTASHAAWPPSAATPASTTSSALASDVAGSNATGVGWVAAADRGFGQPAASTTSRANRAVLMARNCMRGLDRGKAVGLECVEIGRAHV